MTTFTSEDREMAAKHDGIESPHNACCYKDKCRQQQAEIEALEKLVSEMKYEKSSGVYEMNNKPVVWEGAEEWEPLAWELCADEHGEESCHDLIWDMGVIPEPWGERWQKYEDEAKRMISMVRKCTNPAELTDEEIAEVYEKCEWSSGYVYWKEFARAILRKAQWK